MPHRRSWNWTQESEGERKQNFLLYDALWLRIWTQGTVGGKVFAACFSPFHHYAHAMPNTSLLYPGSRETQSSHLKSIFLRFQNNCGAMCQPLFPTPCAHAVPSCPLWLQNKSEEPLWYSWESNGKSSQPGSFFFLISVKFSTLGKLC